MYSNLSILLFIIFIILFILYVVITNERNIIIYIRVKNETDK